MAITNKDSVLIIGAGASAPFGLPLGSALIDLIKDLIKSEISHYNNQWSDSSVIDFRPNSGLGKAQLISTSIGETNSNHHRWKSMVLQPMEQLAHLLTGQTSQTIDDFIAINPDVSELTKIGVAAVFFYHLYKYTNHQWSLKPLSTRYLEQHSFHEDEQTQRRNWIHHLINLVRHKNFGIRSEAISKVRIISFNYDGILEHVLDNQFDNTGHDFGDWKNYIEIVHPHGFMGEPEERVTMPQVVIKKWANSISVVKEHPASEKVTIARRTAQLWTSESRNVYMVGFALSGPNADMLGLGQQKNNPQLWHVANYDGSPGLRRTVEGYVQRTAMSDSPIAHFPEEGSKGDELHIDTWFEIGAAGQMPA